MPPDLTGITEGGLVATRTQLEARFALEPRPRAGVLVFGRPCQRYLARRPRSPAFPAADIRERRLRVAVTRITERAPCELRRTRANYSGHLRTLPTTRSGNDACRIERRPCLQAGVSKSDLAREVLRRFLAVSEFQRLRAKLVRRAQAQGVHADDDVFRLLDRT